MIKYNNNPKNWKTNDCVIRAIALATKQSWDETYNKLCCLGFTKKRMPNDPIVYEKYLADLGWEKHKQPRYYNYEDGYKSSMSKITVEEFIRNLNNEMYVTRKHDTYIITVANHMTCVTLHEGKFELFDTWDCGGKTIGNYWTKLEDN